MLASALRPSTEARSYDREPWPPLCSPSAFPLLSFFAELAAGLPGDPFAWSIAMAAAAFLGTGIAKGVAVRGNLPRSGLETLLLGGGAASLAFVIGYLLRGFVDAAV